MTYICRAQSTLYRKWPFMQTKPNRFPLFNTFCRPIVTHLSPTISLLRSNAKDNEVYLLGTAHVSEASSQEVVNLIRLVQPNVVFVELDAGRAAHLRQTQVSNAHDSQNSGFDESFDTKKIFREMMPKSIPGTMNLPLDNVMSMLQPALALLKRVGWLPPQGGEMKAALEEADRIGARAVYGDIEFQETMRDVKRVIKVAMSKSPTEMMKSMASVPPPPTELAHIFSTAFGGAGSMFGGGTDPNHVIESIKTREHAQLMTKYLAQCFPSIFHIMITKRDSHMASMLRTYCSEGKVVAVVGMAHVEGIEREWEKLDK